MARNFSLVFLVFCVLYVNALPSGRRVRRGFNNSGYGSDRGGGYFGQGSNERDASVSREDGEGCSNDENNDSREHTYGYGRDEYNQNERHQQGRHPR